MAMSFLPVPPRSVFFLDLGELNYEIALVHLNPNFQYITIVPTAYCLS